MGRWNDWPLTSGWISGGMVGCLSAASPPVGGKEVGGAVYVPEPGLMGVHGVAWGPAGDELCGTEGAVLLGGVVE